MVAYNFMPFLAPQVEAGVKPHTIRAPRRRHARPGEALQLYVDQRSRHCRKLIAPDPVCTSIRTILIEVGGRGLGSIEGIEIDGVPLAPAEIARLAATDGFDPRWMSCRAFVPEPMDVFSFTPADRLRVARLQMGWFWKRTHGTGVFKGVLVEWKETMPRPRAESVLPPICPLEPEGRKWLHAAA